MKLGLDVLLEEPSSLRGKRIGLLANAASVTSSFVPAARALREAGLDVRVIFGPEHGFFGAAQDMEPISSRASEAEKIGIVSLYGKTFDDLSPKPGQLDGLDVVVSDLPDVGSRHYTFVWTTALMMKACAGRGLPVVVLDRPNPLGGSILEGNLPEERFLSFVGLYPVPVRHGMTPGEMARFVNSEFGLGCDLTVVPLRGGTGAPWVIPSPNMPTPDTAFVYPCGCLFEGTNLSEGRGTTRPFALVGAPWLDADVAADSANTLGLPGVVFRPHVFKPTFHKHAGKVCGGIQIHVIDPDRFRPFETGLRLIQVLRDLDPGSFGWRTEKYEYRDDVPAIDLLTGTDRYRRLVDTGEPLERWIATFADDIARFTPVRARHLLYGGHPELPPALLVVGAHESGKTMLAARLIEALVKTGAHVGALKHTDHEYETDIEGKDSHRHHSSGAEPALLVAGRRSAAHHAAADRPHLASFLSGELSACDAVIVEGYRSEPFPKIEVVRAATRRPPVAADDPLVIAVVTDRETPHPTSVPRFRLDDFEGVLAVAKRTLQLDRAFVR